jgi:hypothetical protein
MPLTFESFLNVSTHKALTADDDGYLRQYAADSHNRKQDWLRLLQLNPEDGTFKMTSRVSGKVLDNELGFLQVVDADAIGTERWNLVSTDDGADNFLVQESGPDGRVWSVDSDADGEQVYLGNLGLSQNQVWRTHVTEGFDNVFEIHSVAHQNLVLDVPHFSQVDGGLIQQWQEQGGFNQLWDIPPMRNRRTIIRSICSGKLLDYPLEEAKNRTPAAVGQYEANGGDNQTWNIDVVRSGSNGNDIVHIVSGYPGNDLVLDVPFGTDRLGEYIQAYPLNGKSNQQWVLTRA